VNLRGVSEPVPPTTTSDPASGRSPLELGIVVVLAALAFAAVVGVVAVIDSDSRPAGFGVGIGIASLIFLSTTTIACALACLARGRTELAALGSLVASSLAIDLVVLAAWLDIDDEGYVKVAGIAFVWSLFALAILGLALAVPHAEKLARALSAAAITAAVAGGLVSTWLVATSGDDDPISASGARASFFALPLGDEALLQVLGVLLVLLATSWLGALAASRLPGQTLKRTLTTSPSSTT
jgi:hypothetical protein